jgi:hypothetical protein
MSQYNDTDRLNWIESIGGNFVWGLELNDSNQPEYVAYFNHETQARGTTFRDMIDAAVVIDARHKVEEAEHNDKQRQKGILWPSYHPPRDEPKWRVLYKVTGRENCRLDEDGNILYGVKLEQISLDGPYNVAHENIVEAGDYSSTYFELPTALINVGDIFTPSATNFSSDWESGIVDSWDVKFVKTDIQPGDILYKHDI